MTAHVEEPLRIDGDGGVRLVARPESEDPLERRASPEHVADPPSLDQAAGVPEVHHAVRERHGVLDGDVDVTQIAQELAVVAGDLHDDLGVHLHQALGVVVAVQLDHVEPRVLPTLEQVVPHDQRGAVPVVVPQRPRRAGGVQLPQHGRRGAIQRDDPKVVVPASAVIEGKSVRIAGGRSLGQVRGQEVGAQPRTCRPVEEVVAAVVRSEPNLDPTVRVLDHVRLAGPPGPAPHLGLTEVLGLRAHRPTLRIPPQDPGVAGQRPHPIERPRGVAPKRGQSDRLGVDGAGAEVRPRRRPGSGQALRGRDVGASHGPPERAEPIRSPCRDPHGHQDQRGDQRDEAGPPPASAAPHRTERGRVLVRAHPSTDRCRGRNEHRATRGARGRHMVRQSLGDVGWRFWRSHRYCRVVTPEAWILAAMRRPKYR